MHPEISLHEYQLACPNTDRIPTITQRGLVGPVLLRQYRKRVRTARRRAARQRFLASVVSALVWIWRKLTAPTETAHVNPVSNIRYLKPAAAYVDR